MISNRLKQFLQLESSAGLILVVSAAIALICANVSFIAPHYHSLLGLPFRIELGPLILNKNFLLVINDGLMAIFFLLVALEIKREIKAGELSSFGQILLPGVAAIGGIIVPAGIYILLAGDTEVTMRGWAIPSATDIAFSLGVLSLLGSRVPISLKVFLTTVAVVDDLAAILIIALFYTAKLSWLALALSALAIAALAVLNYRGVSRIGPYLLIGVIMWVCVLKSGIHATLAGVIVGLFIPFRDSHTSEISPSTTLEHHLHPCVAYGVLPLFAFANSGVSFSGVSLEMMSSGVSLGIILGLVIGKPVGIFGAICLMRLLGISQLPHQASLTQILGIGMLAGIGFTMSLFIGGLAFEGESLQLTTLTKLGVFSGSLISAIAGYLVLYLSSAPSASKKESSHH